MPSREFDFEDLNLKFLFNFDKFHLFFLVGIRLAYYIYKYKKGVGYESDDKRNCFFQFIYNLVNHFRWFRIFKNSEKAVGRLVNHFQESVKFVFFLQNCKWSER